MSASTSSSGKAGALNAGLPQVTSDYVLMMDADGMPSPDALRWMVPHLVRLPQVAAVTGNPRVVSSCRPRSRCCGARRRPGAG